MNTKKRKNMKPEERRSQLLDCAQELFFGKGYEDTTITDIMKSAGVSKGGFYHHFNSKDELLLGVFERLVKQTSDGLQPVSEDTSGTALERLKSLFEERHRQIKLSANAGQVAAFDALHREENAGLYVRFTRALEFALVPIYAKVIQAGIDEGVFKLPDAYAAADLIIKIGNTSHDALGAAIAARGSSSADSAAQRLSATIQVQGLATDRLLSLPDGTISFRWPGYVDELMN
jgi:AcrR family transcriptional regulator